MKIWGGLAVISIILFVIISNIFSSKTPNVPKQSTYTATPVVKKEEKQPEYKWTNVSSSVFINDKNIPTTILLGQIRSSDFTQENKEKWYIAAYELTSSKNLWIKPFDGLKNEGTYTRFSTFEDGNLYFITNNKNIYRINKDLSI